MQERPEIKTGYRVGMLTVSAKTEERRSRYTVWLCTCDCGGEIRLDTRCLQRGTVTDCGCRSVVKPGMLDLSGQRFGKLVCIRPTAEKDCHGNMLWLCQCDCGNITLATRHMLRTGSRKSCGCLGHPPLKDYVGKRFSMLTVIDYAGKIDGEHRWRCRCDCGNETVVRQTKLQSEKTKSCGCMQTDSFLENLGVVDGTSATMLEYIRTHISPLNTSGHTGVYWSKKSQKWVAQIAFKKKTYYLGSFLNYQDAVAARERGEELHDDFLDWYYLNFPEKEKKRKP